MLIAIENLLNGDQIARLGQAAAALNFSDGKATAGRFVKDVKANDQAVPSPELTAVLTAVEHALAGNAMFQSAARPRAITPLILSRYRAGQTYGSHVDDAVMKGLRTDLSFTLFLADPESYDGGALIIDEPFESRAIKLRAGDMILYPSTTLHRVEPVTRGQRLAVVGWVQSLIRHAEQREMLFDLDQAVEAVFAEHGKSALFDRLAKTRSNLLRMWVDA